MRIGESERSLPNPVHRHLNWHLVCRALDAARD